MTEQISEEKDWDALAEKHLASIKRDMKISLEDAAVRAAHKVMTEFNKPTPEDDAFNHVEMMSKVRQEAVRAQMQALPEKPKFEATTTRLDRIGAESGIEEMTNELYLYGVNVRDDLGKEFNYYFHLTRNDTIEEVARHIEKLQGFGKDTIDSLTVYIREMKR